MNIMEPVVDLKCPTCSYNSQRKHNIDRHIKNGCPALKIAQHAPIQVNDEPLSRIQCVYCHELLSHVNNLARHHTVCRVKQRIDADYDIKLSVETLIHRLAQLEKQVSINNTISGHHNTANNNCTYINITIHNAQLPVDDNGMQVVRRTFDNPNITPDMRAAIINAFHTRDDIIYTTYKQIFANAQHPENNIIRLHPTDHDQVQIMTDKGPQNLFIDMAMGNVASLACTHLKEYADTAAGAPCRNNIYKSITTLKERPPHPAFYANKRSLRNAMKLCDQMPPYDITAPGIKGPGRVTLSDGQIVTRDSELHAQDQIRTIMHEFIIWLTDYISKYVITVPSIEEPTLCYMHSKLQYAINYDITDTYGPPARRIQAAIDWANRYKNGILDDVQRDQTMIRNMPKPV